MKTSNLKRLEKALLNSLKDGEQLELGEDTFLTGYLDGADKIYGFIREGDEILVDGSPMYPYRLSSLEKADIDYIFKYSDIYKKIVDNLYEKDLVD